MAFINCKVELKLKWTKYCVLSAGGNDNVNDNSNNIIFTVKDTKLFVPVVTLLVKDNQNLSKLLRKWFEISVYWKEYKTKSENKNTKYKYRYFLESNFVRVNGFFVLAFTNQDTNAKGFNAQKYYLSEDIIKYYNIMINKKNFYDQPIDFDIKRCEEIRKLATG